jgi:betaine-aldehyde dehydrogenase
MAPPAWLKENVVTAQTTALTPLRNFVDGGYADAESGRTAEIVNPSTGLAYATAPVSGPVDVDRALQAAARAFGGWRDTTPADRQRALLRIADALDARAGEFVQVESRNTGKPLALTATDELPPSSDHFRFFAGAARLLEGVSAGEYLAGHTSFVRREPVGVCGQVTPWNYPLMMAVWKIAPALAAGNTVVLKPSDTTPASTLLLAEVAAEFLPAGVFNVVCGDRDTGRALVEHPIPDMVSITGSVRAGMEVAGSAAHDVKRVHLELGGKAPVIVFGDADLAAAAAGIAGAGFYNAGQDCTAATRVLVHESVHADFAAALAEQAGTQRTGMPDEDGIAYGPVNSAAQLARVTGFLDRLPDHARILTGGHRQGATGFFHQATVVDGLRQADEASQTEIFGPVITVQTFSTEAEAVALANGVDYGLSSSVWTRDHGTAMRMSRALDFGVVWINTHIPFVSEMPHGGFKHSGYGKDLSRYSLEDYTRLKHVMTNLDA